MKFFIVLLAVVAVASAGYIGGGYGGGYGGGHAIAQPWVAPAALVHAPVAHSPVVHAPLPWVAPAPNYVKVTAPVAYAKSYHVATIAQAPAIPAPHPAPISYKGNEHVNRIHYNGNTNGHPHLVGIEHYVAAAEPAIGVVKVGHGHGHGW
ncbi:cuticle protein 65-like isoform X2 [Odontomachus brunneus]|uniref:cuticle protein 65-like isoform X2 n=1 Tax=Odontomachus brunneus TaxID=486640 RepID=UPI0013F1EC20|nr:cuticle protein 65-like isoform X2 [Odontomachus brunneus]